MKKSVLVLWIGLGAFIFSTSAQEKTSSDVNYRPSAALGEKARELLEEVLLELPALESKENQIVASTILIDLIWRQDEKRARQLARETAAKIRSVLAPASEKTEEAPDFPVYSPLKYKHLRADFLLMVVKNDPPFALELAAQTSPAVMTLEGRTESERTTVANWQKAERNLEQLMAFHMAGKDPAEALVIARQSLARDTAEESLNLLRRLQIRDGKSADVFADELIRALLAEDFSKDREAFQMTATFFMQIDTEKGVFGMPRSCNCPAKPLVLNPSRLRQLALKWLDYAATVNDEKVSFDFLEAMPVLERLVPEKKALIRTKFASIRKNAPQRVERAEIDQKIGDKETAPEELAKMASTKTGNERFYLYRQAFVKAANRSKAALETLLASLAEHPESEEKKWVIDEIAANLAGKTAEDGNLDLALEMSQKITRRDRRIGLLAFLALRFLEKGDAQKARQVTDGIAVLLDLTTKDKMPSAIVWYDNFSPVFRTFALTDPDRGFALLESVMPEAEARFMPRSANSEARGAVDLREVLNGNAWMLSMYSKPMLKLAEHDFERTKRLALYFKKNDLAVLAKLLLAQVVLEGRLEWKNFSDRNEMIILNGG
jgi:hypothetical protein